MREEVDRTGDVGHGGETQEEVQLNRINGLPQQQHLQRVTTKAGRAGKKGGKAGKEGGREGRKRGRAEGKHFQNGY